ncbi:hypothetical protein [Streptomyces sp. NPDC059708]|uniref:hypothetical protein n=1 Tax=Streptomyces sp. NPDC059708 TaxID=3346916 RepID=UPI0036B303BD
MDGIVEEEWSAVLRRWDVGDGQEAVFAEMVASEPDRHDWRVVDAALDRLVCSECCDRLGRGPLGCSVCDLAHGFRYAAIETDRPGVPPGNEHAIRVNVSVVRRPQVTSENEVLARRLLLSVLLVGRLPTIEGAQRMSSLIKSSSPGQKLEVIEEAIEEIARNRRARPGSPERDDF